MGTNYLRPSQVESYEQDRAAHKAIVDRPDPGGELKKAVSQQAIQRINKCLEQAPPELTKKQEDAANSLVKTLEEQIKDGMLSHEEMRRCPPGAVDQHRRWSRKNKQRIIDWKNAQLALHRGIDPQEASDLCNVDRLRPRTSNLNLDGAIIPKSRSYSFPSEAYQSQWERIFDKPDEEKEALRAELARLKGQSQKR